MKHLLTFTLTLFTLFATAQNTVQLRDVSFTVPAPFAHTVKENKNLQYDAFYENGRIHKDSLLPNPFSTILYQYYEVPGMGTEHAEVVLKRMSDQMAEDFERDTLILNAPEYYSIAKYNVQGRNIFEVRSLGEKGYINIQLTNESATVAENIKTAEAIAKSVKHSGEYGGEYAKHMKEGANSSKMVIVFLVLFIVATVIGRVVKKAQQNEQQNQENSN